jgi:hypothetical protein
LLNSDKMHGPDGIVLVQFAFIRQHEDSVSAKRLRPQRSAAGDLPPNTVGAGEIADTVAIGDDYLDVTPMMPGKSETRRARSTASST